MIFLYSVINLYIWYISVVVFVVVVVFLDTEYYFNSSSCFEVWRCYLSQTSNGLVAHCDEILTYLNAMRISTSKDELTNAASALEQSQIWQQSELLRTWFQTEWLPIAEVGFFKGNFKISIYIQWALSFLITPAFHLWWYYIKQYFCFRTKFTSV